VVVELGGVVVVGTAVLEVLLEVVLEVVVLAGGSPPGPQAFHAGPHGWAPATAARRRSAAARI